MLRYEQGSAGDVPSYSDANAIEHVGLAAENSYLNPIPYLPSAMVYITWLPKVVAIPM